MGSGICLWRGTRGPHYRVYHRRGLRWESMRPVAAGPFLGRVMYINHRSVLFMFASILQAGGSFRLVKVPVFRSLLVAALRTPPSLCPSVLPASASTCTFVLSQALYFHRSICWETELHLVALLFLWALAPLLVARGCTVGDI